MLSNEDLNLKLSGLAGEVSLISAGMTRLERSMEGFVAHSKTIAELVIQHQHTAQQLDKVRLDNEACMDSHQQATKALSDRLTATTASVNEIRSLTRGAIFAGGAFTSLATAIVFAAASYIFTQVSKNGDTNLIQQQRIEQLERAVARREHPVN